MKKHFVTLLCLSAIFVALVFGGGIPALAQVAPSVRLQATGIEPAEGFPPEGLQNPIFLPVMGRAGSPPMIITQGCSDAIVNGGFENSTGWTIPATAYTAGYSTARAHSGARSLRTGIVATADNRYSYSTGYQAISVPSNAASVWLRFWLSSQTNEPPGKALPEPITSGSFGTAILASDVQYVVILNQSGQIIETLVWQRVNSAGWLPYSIDLTKYAGWNIQILFGAYNDGYDGITSMYVDDVLLEICPPTLLTPTPTVPAAVGCYEEVTNGGFETNQAWDLIPTEYTAGFTYAEVHSGSRSLRTGIVNPVDNRFSYSSGQQDLYIPSNAVSARLSFWWLPETGETPTKNVPPPPEIKALFEEKFAYAGDIQYVLVLDTNNQILQTLIWERSDATNWLYDEFDLSQYRGRTINLRFGTYNDGYWGITSMHIDEVSLEVCLPSTGPTSTPGPTFTPGPTNTFTPVPSITNTPTPSPSNCFEELTNTSFETSQAWIIPITAYPAGYSTAEVNTGSRSMRSGIVNLAENRYSYSDFRQDVYIPWNATDAILRYWTYPLSSEAKEVPIPEIPKGPTFGAEAMAGDVQYLLVLDQYGNWIDTLLWQRSNNRNWEYREVDLSEYKGQSIKLQFGTYNDGYGGITAMFVDDVTLEICLPLSGPTATPTVTRTPAPTNTPANTPTITPTAPPTATSSPTPASCYNRMYNSGFESTSDWVIPDTEYSAGYSTAEIYAGTRSMRTGIVLSGDNRYSYSDFRQTVTIPSSIRSAWLRFWMYPMSTESTTKAVPSIPQGPAFGKTFMAGDVQYLLVLDQYGNWIDTLLWVRSNSRVWTDYRINVLGYAGRTISFQFGTYNDGYGGITAMYVDEVVLELCNP